MLLKKPVQLNSTRLLPMLLFELLLLNVSYGTTYNLTAIDHAVNTTALTESPGGSVTQCAVRCRRHLACVSIETSSTSCRLLAAVPSADQLTLSPGVRVFTDVAAPPPDHRVPHQCPSNWQRVGNACYLIIPSDTESGFWEEDRNLCKSKFHAATLLTIESEEQLTYIKGAVSGRAWTDIRYINGTFQPAGGSPHTFWKELWCDGEPQQNDDGFVFFLQGQGDCLHAETYAVSTSFRMPRTNVVCAIYAGN
ncbi:uncharacterized protein LOC122388000 [Amphibalanus amphitrite]|uniref:uncharacterized protein LOC122388000 n=1 Tax=Amphibalanus amphitrite TaxID=1232801 RepID=UPI001C9276D6|nr:uncharacterized protein LOC122388000 [Amphibalanus amphitrite]